MSKEEIRRRHREEVRRRFYERNFKSAIRRAQEDGFNVTFIGQRNFKDKTDRSTLETKFVVAQSEQQRSRLETGELNGTWYDDGIAEHADVSGSITGESVDFDMVYVVGSASKLVSIPRSIVASVLVPPEKRWWKNPNQIKFSGRAHEGTPYSGRWENGSSLKFEPDGTFTMRSATPYDLLIGEQAFKALAKLTSSPISDASLKAMDLVRGEVWAGGLEDTFVGYFEQEGAGTKVTSPLVIAQTPDEKALLHIGTINGRAYGLDGVANILGSFDSRRIAFTKTRGSTVIEYNGTSEIRDGSYDGTWKFTKADLEEGLSGEGRFFLMKNV